MDLAEDTVDEGKTKGGVETKQPIPQSDNIINSIIVVSVFPSAVVDTFKPVCANVLFY